MIGYIFLFGLMLMLFVLIFIIYRISNNQKCDKCGWSGKTSECIREPVEGVFGLTAVIKCPLCDNIVDVYVGIKL
jgi:hypothetical protein